MPQRITSKKTMTPSAQGRDSFVIFKPVTYGLRRDLRAESIQHESEDTPEVFEAWQREMNAKLYAEYILDWNWVDDDGDPLPLPKDDPTVIDRLNDMETAALEGLFEQTNPK